MGISKTGGAQRPQKVHQPAERLDNSHEAVAESPSKAGWTPKTKATRPAAAAPAAQRLDEAFERAQLGGARKPGVLLSLSEGKLGAGALVTIHGINDAPESMRPFIEQGVSSQKSVSTYCYDDQFRRLGSSAKELASQLAAWQQAHPGEKLTIVAHSMGGRVALAALDRLARKGKLTAEVDLRLVAPPLGGYFAANFAVMAPDLIAQRIPGAQPGKDMGTWSRFQKSLERVELPANVKVTLFTGGADTVVDASSERFEKVAGRLSPELVHLPDESHTSIISAAARWADANGR